MHPIQKNSALLRLQTMGWWTLVWVFAILLSACDRFGNENDIGDFTPVDTGTETSTVGELRTALVITTDYTTGSYATISLGDHAVKKDIAFLHSDLSCRFDPLTKTPFIILRMGADAIDVLNPNTFEIVNEYSVGPATNPHDIAVVSADRAYVSRFGSADMLVVEPTSGTEIGKVNLSIYADDDGIPEVSGMVVNQDKVYVFVKRLDQKNNWEPVAPSYIVVIDALTGTVEDEIALTGLNPDSTLFYSATLDRLVLSEPGSWGSTDDGGIELFNLADHSLSGFIVTERELGGNVLNAVMVSETKGYTIVGVAGDNSSNTHVAIFNPQTGKKTGTLLVGEGWVYSSIALSPDGTQLWIADRTGTAPGIRIFNTADDAEITTVPINVGLPPAMICFTS